MKIKDNHCQKCKSLTDLAINSTRLDKYGVKKHSYLCRNCNTSRAKSYRKTETGYKNTLNAIKKWESKNPKKIRKIRYEIAMRTYARNIKIPSEHKKYLARWKFGDKIDRGLIKRQPCVICQTPNALGHHPDYRKPYLICWLCPKHHVLHHHGKLKLTKNLYQTVY